jgi:phosphoglycerate-specific signal transduction histidine kinase
VQLQQVFMNLMHNRIDAMKEMGGGGELTVKSEVGDGQLLISVSDTTVGLPAEQAEQIFKAFFTTKPKAPEWGFASASQSLSRMAAACGLPTILRAAQLFSSPCPSRSRPTYNLPGLLSRGSDPHRQHH